MEHPSSEVPPKVKVMYLFAGKRRKADVGSYLKEAHDAGRISLVLKEYDIEISPQHDLTQKELWDDIWKTLEEGDWVVIVSPPCNTFSRARFQYKEHPGPRPLRTAVWPRGFPWLSQHHRHLVDEANMFVDRCIETCIICNNFNGKFILEHPEDLGVVQGERPGTIWQWDSVQELVPLTGAVTFAIQQCKFGAQTPKPTRFLTTFDIRDKRCFLGWPKFGTDGHYLGPLPKQCGHKHSHKLIGKTQERWNTSPSAAYPPGLCEFLASLILDAAASFGGGGKNLRKRQLVQPVLGDSDLKQQQQAQQQQQQSGHNEYNVQAVQEQFESSWALEGQEAETSTAAELQGDEGEFSVEECGNYGCPILVEWDGKKHEFIDGFGLCSPSRWPPRSRGYSRQSDMSLLAEKTFGILERAVLVSIGDVRRQAFKLVSGHLEGSPFSAKVLGGIRAEIAALLRDPIDACKRDEGQPFFLRLVAQWLEVLRDPDVDILVNSDDSFATGVSVGVDSPLPRSPQVFPPKKKHRKLDGTEFVPIADNYVSAQLSSKELEEKFREEELLGRMFPSKLSVLKEKYGDRLRVASMAAIAKPDGSVRPLHDGTHSVMVNHAIVYRDQLQCPGPAEVASVVREALESKEAPFCVSADIKSAHRLVKIRERDWPYLCCRADSQSDVVWVNKTGTFGISSAPYWWAKLFACIGRFVGHIMQSAPFWHLVYVDDLRGVFVGERKFLLLWIWILAFEVIGTPFGYHKFKGGFASDFVGFHMRYDLGEVGITLKRGKWLLDWIGRAEEMRFVVSGRDFAEFLGRLGFVAHLLTWLKPHLSPLYSWAAVSSSGLVCKLPDVVVLTLLFLKRELVDETFMTSVKRPIVFESELFRTDAKCTDDFIVLGGWELSSRRWFSLRLCREHVPFLFKPGGGSQWASTSCELLASLAALKAFGWIESSRDRKTIYMTLPAGTDNKANESLSIKRASTKWPLMLINMQLSAALAKARLSLCLQWRPREENVEADDLTNEIYDKFNLADRVDLKFDDLDLSLVVSLWATREEFLRLREEAKAHSAPGISKKARKEKSAW